MGKFYLTAAVTLLFTSCGTQVRYVGNSYAETNHVDVYVTKSAITKPYEIIGKGYAETNNVEKIQKKCIETARAKGANAVLIEDFYLVKQASSITTHLDSTGRGSVESSNTPTLAKGFNIFFIRYKEN